MSLRSASTRARSTRRRPRVRGAEAKLRALWAHPTRHFVLDTLLPAYFFAMVVLAKGLGLWQGIEELPTRVADRGAWQVSTWFLHQGLTAVFLGLVVVLFVIRRPVVGPRTKPLGAVVALGGSFALALLSSNGAEASPWPLLAVSAVLILAGTALAIVSLLRLRDCFGIFPEARGLVTRGPYRWVRHPVYLGEMLSGLGLVLPVLSLANAGVFGLFVGLQYWRAVNEERALQTSFPDYAAYRSRTWRLVPWVH